MIVQYASDLHLDYGQNYEYVLNKGFEEEGNVLILAGDVANLVALRTYRLFWDLCSSNFEKTIFVPGNHDYYGEWDKVEDLIEPIKISIRPNVTCCNNEVVRVGDTDFICSTLWSNIIPEQAAAVNSTLLDFSEITFDGKRITVDDYVAMHKEAVAFLQEAVAGSEAKHIVVVTHRITHPVLLALDAEVVVRPPRQFAVAVLRLDDSLRHLDAGRNAVFFLLLDGQRCIGSNVLLARHLLLGVRLQAPSQQAGEQRRRPAPSLHDCFHVPLLLLFVNVTKNRTNIIHFRATFRHFFPRNAIRNGPPERYGRRSRKRTGAATAGDNFSVLYNSQFSCHN